MLGMSNTAVRDRLTLLEGAPSVVETSNRHAGYYRADAGESGLVQDDTLLMMDRLREVTQKALQLEVRYFICTMLIWCIESVTTTTVLLPVQSITATISIALLLILQLILPSSLYYYHSTTTRNVCGKTTSPSSRVCLTPTLKLSPSGKPASSLSWSSQTTTCDGACNKSRISLILNKLLLII